MNFSKFYISEMLVIGSPKDSDFVVAFDKWIWLLDQDIFDEKVVKDIIAKVTVNHPDEEEYLLSHSNDTWDLISNLTEKFEDVLIGQINGSELYIQSGGFKLDPKASILVKKVISQLKLKTVKYIEDLESTETIVKKKEMKGELGTKYFHGTASRYLRNILRFGLKPSESPTNFEEIEHPDAVFITTMFGKAVFHSEHAVQQINVREDNDYAGGVPVIIEFSNIPDKDKLIPDYDVNNLTDKDNKRREFAYKQDSLKLSKEFGIFGYEGRIPATFIKYVWVAGFNAKNDAYFEVGDFKRMKPSAALKLIDKMEEYGYEF